MFMNGQTIGEGYKPDFVLKRGNEYIIFESENSTSRKTYVGGMMKAAYFLQGNRKGKLVFVIVPRANTKASSIAAHLVKYLTWIEGKTNLKDVYVVEASHYYANDVVLEVCSKEFNSLSYKV
jgi:hypothetical protein